MITYTKEGKKFLIFYHDEKSSLPKDGWFHSCLICGCVTANEQSFIYKKKELKVIICNDCEKSNKLNNYKDKLNYFIKKNIPELRCNFFCNII